MNLDPKRLGTPAQPRDYYVGVDLGQKRDHTVVAVVEKTDEHITLRQLKRFKLGTEYTTILDYLNIAQTKFETVHGFYIDQTGVGEGFVENARKHGLRNVVGIVLTMPMKQEVMTCLKQAMEEKRPRIPRDHELENEMNGEIAEITSTGKTKFHHRTGTHDDRLWALGLAVYGARHDIIRYHPVVLIGSRKDIFGRTRPDWTSWVRRVKTGESEQDRHDQLLTSTNLSAKILNRDPRATIGMAPPPVRSMPPDANDATSERRICLVCWTTYLPEIGRDSPCGHVKHNGTIVL